MSCRRDPEVNKQNANFRNLINGNELAIVNKLLLVEEPGGACAEPLKHRAAAPQTPDPEQQGGSGWQDGFVWGGSGSPLQQSAVNEEGGQKKGRESRLIDSLP